MCTLGATFLSMMFSGDIDDEILASTDWNRRLLEECCEAEKEGGHREDRLTD